jgi:hypothetical protein
MPGADGAGAANDDRADTFDPDVDIAVGGSGGFVELGLFEALVLTSRRRKMCSGWIQSYRSVTEPPAAASRRVVRYIIDEKEDGQASVSMAPRLFELLLAYGVILRGDNAQSMTLNGAMPSQAKLLALEAEGSLSPRSAAAAAADIYSAAINSHLRKQYGVQSYKVRMRAASQHMPETAESPYS